MRLRRRRARLLRGEGLKKILVLAVLLAALATAPGCGRDGGSQAASPTEPTEPDPIAVSATPVGRAAIASLYSTSATLRADRQATVTARTRGVIRRLHVEEGNVVTEGQPLVELEDDEQRIEAQRRTAARDAKRRELERSERLHSQGLLSDETYEVVHRDALEADQAAALAELTLSRTVVRAPFGGRILRRHLDVGATVSDGSPLYDLADLDPLYVDVNVPERHLPRLHPGQAVRLTADAVGSAVEARIERIAPAVDPATGTVKVTLAAHADAALRPGAFVRVEIVTDTHTDALVVPRSALVAEGRRWHVFRLDESGERVTKVEVTLGYEENDRVEVVGAEGAAAPLDADARVVTAGASALTEGARVRVIEAAAS
jgi:membrane fusion protein (multidrug efflux system)